MDKKIIKGTLYPSERQARRWGLAKIPKGSIVKVSGGYIVVPKGKEKEYVSETKEPEEDLSLQENSEEEKA